MVVGCVPPSSVPSSVLPPPTAALDAHIPPFARWPYQAFSREAAVQIALREWRAFGQPVVYPNVELPEDEEREEGLWQRVGEYWWLGLRSEEHTSELQSRRDLVCRLLLEKKKKKS